MMDDEPSQTKFNYDDTATAQNHISKTNRSEHTSFQLADYYYRQSKQIKTMA